MTAGRNEAVSGSDAEDDPGADAEGDLESGAEDEPDTDARLDPGTDATVDPDTDTTVDPDTDAVTDEVDRWPEWLSGPWYESRLGVGIVLADLLLTFVLVYATVVGLGTGFEELADVPLGVVPWYIYVFSVLGALGFVFTALIDDFHRETGEVLQHNVRLPAALPLGAGVFLLSDVLVGDVAAAEPLVVGVVFLAGLYVNLAYRQLGALAKRLLPGESQKPDRSSGDGTERSQRTGTRGRGARND